MKNKIAVFLTIVVVLSSCTMQKRYHNSGFNLGLNHHFTRSAKVNALPKKSVLQTIQNPISESLSTGSVRLADNNRDIAYKNEFVGQTVGNSVAEKALASTETEISHGSLQLGNKSMRDAAAITQIQTKTLKAKSVLSSADLKSSKRSTSSESGGSGLRGVGVFFLIIGLLVLLFVSIIAGLFLAVLGLIFMSSGKSADHRNNVEEVIREEKKIEYVEVLYLKNGSIIRGMIIEQIPNEQVKIKTSDGSVFVYTMDQVLKITKEPK
jgi:cell division protein FtsL